MNLVLDMNLSPSWIDFFENTFVKAVHWSSIGAVDAEDEYILNGQGKTITSFSQMI